MAQSYHYTWNDRTQQIYNSITQLKIPEARKMLQADQKGNEYNLIYPLLYSYADFYQLFLNGSQADFENYYPVFKQRINQFEKGPKNNPYYLYCLGLGHLHKGLVALRFEKNFEGALDFRKSYLLLKENKDHFPQFTPTNFYLGILSSAVGTIPKGFQWVANLFGMSGKISEGNAMVLNYINSKNEFSQRSRNEALFVYPYLVMFFENNEKKAFEFLERPEYDFKFNQMHAYMAVNLNLNHQRSAKALAIMNQIDNNDSYLKLPFWHLESGYANLNELKLEVAQKELLEFINTNKGFFYIKDAYEKLSWIALLQNDLKKAQFYRTLVLNKGTITTDADKNALQNANDGKWPHPTLLKARLLSDGGYQSQALNILAGKNSNDFTNDEDKTEFAYRLGRIYDLMNQHELAIKFYTSAIEKGEHLTAYFAARAALQIGIIYEQKGQFSKAIDSYNHCLNMKNHAFKNSLDQKAKSGIQRCSKE
jgi:tetratricopeptide (TPR) repeat protein